MKFSKLIIISWLVIIWCTLLIASVNAQSILTVTPGELRASTTRDNDATISLTLLLHTTETITSLQIIPLDLARIDGQATIPAANIRSSEPVTQLDADTLASVPIVFNLGRIPSGEFKGELWVTYPGETVKVPITITIRDTPIFPLVVLFLGVGLGLVVSGYRTQGKPRDELLVRIGQIRLLVDALKAEGVEGLTLLDIGGGVGAVHHELLGAGVTRATDVDASSAYLAAAREESARRGHADRVSYQHGDFVELAPQIEEADIVTLDRVICCYPDVLALVGSSAERAAKLFGAVFPRDRWWVRIGLMLGNFFLWLSRDPFRTFVHPTDAVERVLRDHGLEKRYHRDANAVWQVVVFARNEASSLPSTRPVTHATIAPAVPLE